VSVPAGRCRDASLAFAPGISGTRSSRDRRKLATPTSEPAGAAANIADDEPLVSESDQLAMSGAFDIDDQAVADNRELITTYLQAGSFEIRTLLWFLPFFHHVYFGAPTLCCGLPITSHANTGSRTAFTATDVGRRPSVRCRQGGTGISALAQSTFTSAQDFKPGQLPPADAAIATLWTSAYPLLHLRNVGAKFYFVQDNEQQFYPAGAASAMVEHTYRFGFPGIVNTPGLADVYRSYGNRRPRSFLRWTSSATTLPPSRETPAVRSGCFFYGRPKTRATPSDSGSRRWPCSRSPMAIGSRSSVPARTGTRRSRARGTDSQSRGPAVPGGGRRPVSQLRHRPGVHAHQASELPAVRVHASGMATVSSRFEMARW